MAFIIENLMYKLTVAIGPLVLQMQHNPTMQVDTLHHKISCH